MTDTSDLMSLMPFAEHLGVRGMTADPERGEARLGWAPHLCTAAGILHGVDYEHTGRIEVSLDVLDRLGITVMTLDGTRPYPGGQRVAAK